MTKNMQEELKGAVCKWCEQNMLKAHDCTKNRTVEYPDGTILPSVPYLDDDDGRRCHDCNILVWNLFHVGCVWDSCSRCAGLLI